MAFAALTACAVRDARPNGDEPGDSCGWEVSQTYVPRLAARSVSTAHPQRMHGANRELGAVGDDSVGLGTTPPREQVLHHARWEHAAAALHLAADTSDFHPTDLRAEPEAVLRAPRG